MSDDAKTGSCLCGEVAYEVTGPLRPVVNCHCLQCRKTTGHFMAATFNRTAAGIRCRRLNKDAT